MKIPSGVFIAILLSLALECHGQVHQPNICEYCEMLTADAIQGSAVSKQNGFAPRCQYCCRDCEVIFRGECCCECDSVDFDRLGIDVARRAVVLQCPRAARLTISADDVRHCREGHMVYVYVKMSWRTRGDFDVEGEIYLAFVDQPCRVRRLVDINYRDTHVVTRRNFQHLAEVVTAVNEELAARDTLPSVTRCSGTELETGKVDLTPLPRLLGRKKLIDW